MEQVRNFFVQNFGCRATQADGAALEAQLAAKGLEAAAERADADLVMLNTCTVTAAADDDVRQTIRRVHRENPAARILVTGCYAQRAPEELAEMPGVEWVVGNSHKTQIADLVSWRSRPITARSWSAIFSRSTTSSPRRWRTPARRPHAAQSEDPGRLPQSLLVLHHSVRARRAAAARRRTRWWSRCARWRRAIAKWC